MLKTEKDEKELYKVTLFLVVVYTEMVWDKGNNVLWTILINWVCEGKKDVDNFREQIFIDVLIYKWMGEIAWGK